MSTIDKQRIAAVAKLQALGYSFSLTDGWTPPGCPSDAAVLSSTGEADAMHAVLTRRADALQGRSEGSGEEAELERIVDAIEAYEAKRWPEGREPGGKG
jgi:hypothetical protein